MKTQTLVRLFRIIAIIDLLSGVVGLVIAILSAQKVPLSLGFLTTPLIFWGLAHGLTMLNTVYENQIELMRRIHRTEQRVETMRQTVINRDL